MLRILLIPMGLIALLLGALAWSGGGVRSRADFAFINRGDIITLDLNQMSYLQDFRVTNGIREGLYTYDVQTLLPIKALVREADLSEDKRVWTFHLRPEAKWSNGDPVTSHDFVFSWRRMLEEPGEYTYLFYYIKNAREYETRFVAGETVKFDEVVGVEALDDHTLRVTLNDPVPFLEDLFAFAPFFPRHERSMAPFRTFSDSGVMEPFQRYLSAAKRVPEDATAEVAVQRLGAALETDFSRVPGPAVVEFVNMARSFELERATQAEILELLDRFAPLEPFSGDFTAARKLAAMRQGRFLRYTYRTEYTRPPHVVTNGPFELVDWDFKRRLLFRKSDHYWDKENVKLDTIEMVVNENTLSQFLAYEAKGVEWLASVDPDIGAELLKQGRPDLFVTPAFGTAFLTYNCLPEFKPDTAGASGKNPLADRRVRQALTMAIDKEFIVRNITRLGEPVSTTYIPPGSLPGYQSTPGLPYDVRRARELLAEAGYPNGRGFPRLPIIYNNDSPVRRGICQSLKSQWKEKLGIDIELHGVELKLYRDKVTNKEYAISPVGWYGDYMDASTFTDKYLSTSLQNDAAWEHPEYDQLCYKGTKEADPDKRLRLLEEAERIVNTEVPIAPLYTYTNAWMHRENVKGIYPNPKLLTMFKGIDVIKER